MVHLSVMSEKESSEWRERTLEEQQASCFGILGATEEDMDEIIRRHPYVLSKLKDI